MSGSAITATARATALLALLSAPFVIIGVLLAGVFPGVIAGVGVAVVVQMVAWAISRPALLHVCRATRVDDDTHLLVQTVARLANGAGVRPPAVAICDVRAPNAFAAATPGGGVVGVTTGALELLSPVELEAVLAHEVAHLARGGRALATIAALFAAMPGAIGVRYGLDLLFDPAFTRSVGPRRGQRYLRPVRDGIARACLLTAATCVRPSGPSVDDRAADCEVTRLLGQPFPLIAALRKLDTLAGRVVSPVNPAISHLLVVHPFSSQRFGRLFNTRPPLVDRLDALAVAGDGLPAVVAPVPIEP